MTNNDTIAEQGSEDSIDKIADEIVGIVEQHCKKLDRTGCSDQIARLLRDLKESLRLSDAENDVLEAKLAAAEALLGDAKRFHMDEYQNRIELEEKLAAAEQRCQRLEALYRIQRDYEAQCWTDRTNFDAATEAATPEKPTPVSPQKHPVSPQKHDDGYYIGKYLAGRIMGIKMIDMEKKTSITGVRLYKIVCTGRSITEGMPSTKEIIVLIDDTDIWCETWQMTPWYSEKLTTLDAERVEDRPHPVGAGEFMAAIAFGGRPQPPQNNNASINGHARIIVNDGRVIEMDKGNLTPSKDFDANFYLKENPDVAAHPYFGKHPYEHYVYCGKTEHRKTHAEK